MSAASTSLRHPSPVDPAALAALLGDPVPASEPTSAGDEYARGAQTAERFLQFFTASWCGDWWLNICAKGSGSMEGRSWRASDLPGAWPEIARYISDRNRSGRQLYFCADPLARRVDSKPRSDDVAAVTVLHADIDPDVAAAGSFETARAVLWRAVDEIHGGSVPITWVVDSGHGAGLFAILETPLDPAAGVAARLAWQGRLRARLAGVVVDHTQDAGRIMRLPGPRNWPEPQKVARGYPEQGSWASVRKHQAGAVVPVAVADELAAEAPHRVKTEAVPEAELQAPSAARLSALLADMPNPDTLDRAGWVDVLRATRAAGAGVVDDDGEDAARGWSACWPGGHDEDEFTRVWHSVAGPSRIGWRELVGRAEALGSEVGRREGDRLRLRACQIDFAPYLAGAAYRFEAAPPRAEAFGRLRPRTVADAVAAPPRDHLLKPLLGRGEFSEWWGAPKTGKSFLVLRLLYGLSLGLGAWDLKAKRACRVLYVAAEGEGGFAGRLVALRAELGDPGDAFQYVAQPVQIGPPGVDLDSVLSLAKAMRADIIALDTLARTFGAGDENTAKDMSQYVAAVDRIRHETGAHVLVIHHGRKDGADARGSGALGAAVDLIVKVEKGRDGAPSTATVEAAKDDVDGRVFGFRLTPVDLGSDEDGDPRWTCIASPVLAPAHKPAKLPSGTEAALSVLRDLIANEGAVPPDVDTGAARAVPDDRWRAECEARRISTAADKEGRDRAMRRAIENARDAGRLEMHGGWVWIRPERSA